MSYCSISSNNSSITLTSGSLYDWDHYPKRSSSHSSSQQYTSSPRRSYKQKYLSTIQIQNMKTGKMVYLRGIIIVFILILIPFFQNIALGWDSISFYLINTTNVIDVYLWIISLGMIEGVLITLYIQWFISDIKNTEPTKFDLNK